MEVLRAVPNLHLDMVGRAAIIMALLLAMDAGAQTPVREQGPSTMPPDLFFGVGIGLDHGGIGMRMDVRFTEHIGLFGGAGYNLAMVGWNAGLIYRYKLLGHVRPYATGMYGYNLAMRWVDPWGKTVHGENYYGPSFGGGVEFWSARRDSFIHVGLLVPVRSSETLDAMKWAY